MENHNIEHQLWVYQNPLVNYLLYCRNMEKGRTLTYPKELDGFLMPDLYFLDHEGLWGNVEYYGVDCRTYNVVTKEHDAKVWSGA